MYKRFSKIIGVAAAISTILSMFVFAAPASAMDDELKWDAQPIPGDTNDTGKVIEGNPVLEIALAPDNKTVYAVVDAAPNKLYKSTNLGQSWTSETLPAGADPVLVAVAPDNADMVVYVDSTRAIYIRTSAGGTFSSLGTPDATGGGHAATTVNDIDISPAVSGVRNITIAGVEAGPIGSVWYFDYGATVAKWRIATIGADAWTVAGFTACAAVKAVKFSPNFASDRIMAVITSADVAAGLVLYQVAQVASKVWNSGIGGYTGTGVTVGTLAAPGNLQAASITFDQNYLGPDSDSRLVYVGVAMNTGDASHGNGGIIRIKDVTTKWLKDQIKVNSVAFNSAANKLVAGEYGGNLVWRCANPDSSDPTVSSATSLKRPGIDGVSAGYNQVLWADKTVIAIAGGPGAVGGSFAVSTDDGKTFSEISLINATKPIATINDFAVSDNGSKIIMVTQDANTSVWLKDGSTWKRILGLNGVLNLMVRTAPENFNVVYLGEMGNTNMYYSADLGATKWTKRFATEAIADFCVESADVVYIAKNASSQVIKSTNAGFIWSSTKSTNLAGGNIASIHSMEKDKVVVSSGAGYVAYTTDGNSNWTSLTSVVIPGGVTSYISATGLAAGDFVYAVPSVAPGGDQNVYRWKIGTSEKWDDIMDGTMGASIVATDLQLGRDGTLYALTYDSTPGKAGFIRLLSPASATDASKWSGEDTAVNAEFIDVPQAMVITKSTSARIWAIDTIGADVLYSFSDTVVDKSPDLSQPADGFQIQTNEATGRATDIAIAWNRPSKATTYDIQIALDKAFTQKVWSKTTNSTTDSVVTVVLGPYTAPSNVASTSTFEYQPGTQYFWRVRVAQTGPAYSPWSTVRSFTTANVVPFSVVAPAAGATGVPTSATLMWNAASGAAKYEVTVSEDPNFGTATATKIVTTNYFKVEQALKDNSTYFFKIQALTDGGQALGKPVTSVFTTAAKPTTAPPPVVVTQPASQAPPQVIQVPVPGPAQPIPSYLLWAIIIIGAVLVLALIVLIVRTRRVS